MNTLTATNQAAMAGRESGEEPRYSVATWDGEAGAYTPQDGLSVPSFNITLPQLRQAVRDLRNLGYTAHRVRDADGDHWDNDASVLIERTDGMTEAEILETWKR